MRGGELRNRRIMDRSGRQGEAERIVGLKSMKCLSQRAAGRVEAVLTCPTSSLLYQSGWMT